MGVNKNLIILKCTFSSDTFEAEKKHKKNKLFS